MPQFVALIELLNLLSFACPKESSKEKGTPARRATVSLAARYRKPQLTWPTVFASRKCVGAAVHPWTAGYRRVSVARQTIGAGGELRKNFFFVERFEFATLH